METSIDLATGKPRNHGWILEGISGEFHEMGLRGEGNTSEEFFQNNEQWVCYGIQYYYTHIGRVAAITHVIHIAVSYFCPRISFTSTADNGQAGTYWFGVLAHLGRKLEFPVMYSFCPRISSSDCLSVFHAHSSTKSLHVFHTQMQWLCGYQHTQKEKSLLKPWLFHLSIL